MSLATIEQFAGYIRSGLSELDAYTAQLCLDGATGAVVEYCGWHIAPALTEDVTVDGSGTRVQPLPTLLLTELHTVTEHGDELDIADIDWSANGLMEKRQCGTWTRRRRGVEANITHGYDETPSWVVTLICAVAARGFLTTPGVMSEQAGGEGITYDTARSGAPPGVVGLMDIEKKMLDRIALPLGA